MPEKNHKKQQLLELLKIHYGFSSFRPGQERVIDNILAGKNTVVIMPTGGGKSLCFQLPALVLDGVTVVVSPLIALMKDQVDGLQRMNIPATAINSTLSLAETTECLSAVKRGEYKLLYVAPERFYSAEFTEMLNQIKVSLFAIDESHCISQWGHDFRPSYLKLRYAIEQVGKPIVIALTATATPEVREDIIKQLGLTDSELVITGFSRPNLQFGVIQTSDSQKSRYVMDVIEGMPQGSGIVYVGTRARADSLLQTLLEYGVEAVGYHAGMDIEERKWVQENFMSGKAKVIVATNAFGLGIDKRDIRFVIHYDMPGTIEAYYQEAGRAGRDGRPSFCLLLYSPRDRYLQEFFIKGDNPPPEIILEIYNNLRNYETDKILITYAELADGLSDNVPEMAVGTSLKILEREGYLARAREKNGQAHLKQKATNEEIIASLGKRAKNHLEIWRKLVDKYQTELNAGWQANLNEVAEIVGAKRDAFNRLIKKLKDKGLVDYLPPFKGTEINLLKRVSGDQVEINWQVLKDKLKHAYKKLDRVESYIFHFACRQKYILGYFGEHGADDCGKCDICLAQSSVENEIGSGHVGPMRKKDETKLETKLTQLVTYDLYNQGLDVDAMAAAREYTRDTIIKHLCYLMEKGLPIDIDKFVKPDKQEKIKQAVEKIGPDKLTPLKDELGDGISWEEIKLVLSSMRKIK